MKQFQYAQVRIPRPSPDCPGHLLFTCLMDARIAGSNHAPAATLVCAETTKYDLPSTGYSLITTAPSFVNPSTRLLRWPSSVTKISRPVIA